MVEASWKDVCKVMMEQYTERTTGTLIESDKVACITWHYGTAHQDWARMQVCFCQSHCLLTSVWCQVGESKISDRGGTSVWDKCVCSSRILTVNCRMRQAKELLNQLRETLVHFPVEVLIGKSFVKVRHRGVEKVIICLVCVCDCD